MRCLVVLAALAFSACSANEQSAAGEKVDEGVVGGTSSYSSSVEDREENSSYELFDEDYRQKHAAPAILPQNLAFVKLSYRPKLVEKPMPVIYFTNRSVPVNIWVGEANVVVSGNDLNGLLSIASQVEARQQCIHGSVEKDVFDTLMFTFRTNSGQETACLISARDQCRLLASIWSYEYEKVKDGRFDDLSELSNRIGCKNIPRSAD